MTRLQFHPLNYKIMQVIINNNSHLVNFAHTVLTVFLGIKQMILFHLLKIVETNVCDVRGKRSTQNMTEIVDVHGCQRSGWIGLVSPSVEDSLILCTCNRQHLDRFGYYIVREDRVWLRQF